MLKITILCVGSIKESFYKAALNEYAKRLTPYCKLEIVEVADERLSEHAPEAEKAIVLKKEAERILKKTDDKGALIALAIDGTRYSSEGFASLLEDYAVKGVSHIQFLIGSSVGLDEELIKQSDKRVSFSDMTFPHQLMRVILTEQIYRAFKINNGEPYHK